MRSNTILKAFLSLLAVAMTVWVASRHTFYHDTISSSFLLSIALLSVFLILLRTRLSWVEIVEVFTLVTALAVLDLRLLGYPAAWPVWMSFIGLSSLPVLCGRAIWSEGNQRRLAIFALVPAVLFITSEWCADYFLDWTREAHPLVLDLYLYSFDASLHAQIPFAVGRLFQQWPPLAVASFLFYLALPLGIGFTFAGCLMREKRNAFAAFLAFLLTGPVGALLYNLFPALGPVHIFKESFPWHPLSIEQASRLVLQGIPGDGARNAMPSLHAAWVFEVLWYSWRLSKVDKMIAGLLIFFTLCATVGLGEHYFVDLIVAVPFALFMVALASLLAGRDRRLLYIPLIVGAVATGVWFIALRSAIRIFWISPVIPWVSCLATLVLCFFAARELAMPLPEPSVGEFIPECPAQAVKAREA